MKRIFHQIARSSLLNTMKRKDVVTLHFANQKMFFVPFSRGLCSPVFRFDTKEEKEPTMNQIIPTSVGEAKLALYRGNYKLILDIFDLQKADEKEIPPQLYDIVITACAKKRDFERLLEVLNESVVEKKNKLQLITLHKVLHSLHMFKKDKCNEVSVWLFEENRRLYLSSKDSLLEGEHLEVDSDRTKKWYVARSAEERDMLKSVYDQLILNCLEAGMLKEGDDYLEEMLLYRLEPAPLSLFCKVRKYYAEGAEISSCLKLIQRMADSFNSINPSELFHHLITTSSKLQKPSDTYYKTLFPSLLSSQLSLSFWHVKGTSSSLCPSPTTSSPR